MPTAGYRLYVIGESSSSVSLGFRSAIVANSESAAIGRGVFESSFFSSPCIHRVAYVANWKHCLQGRVPGVRRFHEPWQLRLLVQRSSVRFLFSLGLDARNGLATDLANPRMGDNDEEVAQSRSRRVHMTRLPRCSSYSALST